MTKTYTIALSVCMILITLVVLLSSTTKDWMFYQSEEKQQPLQKVESEPSNEVDQANEIVIPYLVIDEDEYVSLVDIDSALNAEIHVDQTEGIATVKIGLDKYKLTRDTPAIERDGIFLPNEKDILFIEQDVFVPLSFLSKGLGYTVRESDSGSTVHLQILYQPTGSSVGSDDLEDNPIILESLSAMEVADYLSFLEVPIDGAQVSQKPSHLPGALRSYRYGIHEGIDWYSGTTGIEITETTPVMSMANGVVVRADHNYREYTQEDRERDLTASMKVSTTPAYILDKLRGRSVWVQYDNGVMVRYAHLSAINEKVQVGQQIMKGEMIGYVGNSGTSYGVEGSLGGLHLHSDILIYGQLFWEHLSSDEIQLVMGRLFSE